MTLFDFFQASELPAPAVSVDDAVTIAHEHFGLDVTASPLGSQQDANFLLTATDGEPVGVLKVANPVFSRVEIEAQDAAAQFVADADPRVRGASNIGLPGVPPIAEISDGTGGLLYARIITYLAGGTMSGEGYIAPDRWAALGALAGRASRALAAFDHPGVDRVLQWDLQHADRTIDLLTHYVSDPVRRRLVETAAVSAWRTVTDLAGELPQSGDPLRHHRRQRGVLRRRRPPGRRHHRLRRPHPVVGRRRTRGDGVVGAAPRRWRTGGDAAPHRGVRPRAAAATRRDRRAVAAAWCCAPPPWWSVATSRPPSMWKTITPQVLSSWNGGSSSGLCRCLPT